MLGFITKMFSRPPEAQDTQLPPVPSQANKLYVESQREMVRSVLKHLVQAHGVPKGYVASEVMSVARRGKKEDLVVELIVLKWSDTLMRCAQAFERELLLRLDRIDPGTNHSKFLIHWSFASDCGSPLSKMPPPEAWGQGESTGRKFDLPLSEKDFLKDDFAPTVPGPLR
jgi:hypothetical protein